MDPSSLHPVAPRASSEIQSEGTREHCFVQMRSTPHCLRGRSKDHGFGDVEQNVLVVVVALTTGSPYCARMSASENRHSVWRRAHAWSQER